MSMLTALAFVALSSSPLSAQAVPPPLPTQVQLYHYNGPSGTGQYEIERIAELVAQERDAQHLVWQQGWAEWKAWDQVDALASAVSAAPPPPPVSTEPMFSYHGPDGQTLQLSAADVAARVQFEGGKHLVWRAGMPAWTDAEQVDEIKAAMGGAPPPLPAPTPEPAPEPTPEPTPEPAPEPAVEPAPEPASAELADAAAEPAKGGCCGSGHKKPRVKVGGEVWFNASAENLQNAAPDDGLAFTPTFMIKRARVKVGMKLTDNISSRLMVDFPQDGGSSEYTASMQTVYDRLAALEGSEAVESDTDLSIDVRDYPDGWSTILKDAYLDWNIGNNGAHMVRAGMQKPVFGSRDWFDDYDTFFLGGNAAYKTLGWRAGLVDSRDLGLRYELSPGDLWSVDAQVLNGVGDSDFDDNVGKDVIGRVSLNLPVGLGIQASGLYGARDAGGESSLSMLDASVRMDILFMRLMAEGIYGTLASVDNVIAFGGFQAAGSASVPLSAKGLKGLDITGRFMFFDPEIQAPEDVPFPDAWWATNAAVYLDWDVGCRQHLLTGVSFENFAPQNADESVENTLVGQVVWKY